MHQPAEPAGGIEGSEHAHVVAAAEELLGERLDVPVHAALIVQEYGETRAIRTKRLRVTAGCWSPASAQAKPVKTSR